MLSAEERKRQRELEEARKAGLAAPEVREWCVCARGRPCSLTCLHMQEGWG
jgi:hypothetical protein